ncbi:hypothetical protein ACGFI9_21760 [Micromonospora sp. NPDC048930]|uniref:hypothetical protein n=1 Tax=Micromonospora sp. NPDC048930 TaxID=3364261 RepID=UPI003716C4FE
MTFNVHTDPDDAGDGAVGMDSPAGRDDAAIPSGSPAVATAGPPGDNPIEPAAAVTHPSWCDRQACTAQPTPTMDDYREAGAFGSHVSAVVGDGLEKLRLTQSVAPWSTSVFLKVIDDHVLPLASFDLHMLGRYLAELGCSPAGPLTEAELIRGRDRAGTVTFSPAWTADPAGRYLAGAVEALVTAERVDPLQLVDELRAAFAVCTALAEGRRQR